MSLRQVVFSSPGVPCDRSADRDELHPPSSWCVSPLSWYPKSFIAGWLNPKDGRFIQENPMKMMVYFIENPTKIWMMTRGSPMTKRKPP